MLFLFLVVSSLGVLLVAATAPGVLSSVIHEDVRVHNANLLVWAVGVTLLWIAYHLPT